MTHHDDDIRGALNRLPSVEADAGFRARLRLDAQREFQRVRKASGEERRSRDRLTGRQTRRAPAAGASWLPWSMAVAASVMAIVFNVGGEFRETVRVDSGLAMVGSAPNEWVRLTNDVVHDEDANKFYVGPDSELTITRQEAKIVAADDVRVDIEDGDTIHCSATGSLEITPNREELTVVVGKTGGRVLLQKAKVHLTMNGAHPEIQVYSGVATHIDAEGNKRVVRKGQKAPLMMIQSLPRIDREAIKQFEALVKEGEVLGRVLPERPGDIEQKKISNLLVFVSRLGAPNEKDLRAAYKMMPSLRGDALKASKHLIENQTISKMVRIKSEIEERRRNRTVAVQDKIGREYRFSRGKGDNTFKVYRAGHDMIEMTREQIFDLPPEVIARLPKEWGFGQSR